MLSYTLFKMSSVGASSKTGGPSSGASETDAVELDSEGKQAGPNKQKC